MKLLIGLGNPGIKYSKNRHNAGHLLIDAIGSPAGGLQHDDVKILKTNCFMNESGDFVKKFPLENLYIAHDDLDIPLGQFKIQFGIGPKVHNGINSIESALGGKDFWRIRIGIDNRRKDAIGSPAGGLQHDGGGDYVLQDFTKDELEILKQVQDDIYAELKERFSKS